VEWVACLDFIFPSRNHNIKPQANGMGFFILDCFQSLNEATLRSKIKKSHDVNMCWARHLAWSNAVSAVFQEDSRELPNRVLVNHSFDGHRKWRGRTHSRTDDSVEQTKFKSKRTGQGQRKMNMNVFWRISFVLLLLMGIGCFMLAVTSTAWLRMYYMEDFPSAGTTRRSDSESGTFHRQMGLVWMQKFYCKDGTPQKEIQDLGGRDDICSTTTTSVGDSFHELSWKYHYKFYSMPSEYGGVLQSGRNTPCYGEHSGTKMFCNLMEAIPKLFYSCFLCVGFVVIALLLLIGHEVTAAKEGSKKKQMYALAGCLFLASIVAICVFYLPPTTSYTVCVVTSGGDWTFDFKDVFQVGWAFFVHVGGIGCLILALIIQLVFGRKCHRDHAEECEEEDV
jgi:hypothetical protein